MIFVTVGTQLTFDRLITSVDKWAGENLNQKVVVQAGNGNVTSLNCELKKYLEPKEWEELFCNAEFVIAHAGMGTILKCLDANKPLIIMPRQASLGEHRNEHQNATVSKFINIPGIMVVNDELQLLAAIKDIQSGKCILANKETNNLNDLIRNLKSYASDKEVY